MKSSDRPLHYEIWTELCWLTDKLHTLAEQWLEEDGHVAQTHDRVCAVRAAEERQLWLPLGSRRHSDSTSPGDTPIK